MDNLAARWRREPGVADVRYDRRWLSRWTPPSDSSATIGLVIVALLALAAALTVANVVRLAAYARRDEIEIMQLVGRAVRLHPRAVRRRRDPAGGVGAILAIVAALGDFPAGRPGTAVWRSRASASTTLTFLPFGALLALVVGGMLLGCVGGLIVARTVR